MTSPTFAQEDARADALALAERDLDKPQLDADAALERLLAAGFAEWERRLRETPEAFQSEALRLLRETPESCGAVSASYFLSILRDLFVTRACADCRGETFCHLPR